MEEPLLSTRKGGVRGRWEVVLEEVMGARCS